MIFLVQIGIKKHLLMFSKTTSQISQILRLTKSTRAYLLQIALEIIWLPIQITLFSAFSHLKHVFVYLQINLAVMGLISRKATFSFFLLLNYAAFSFMTLKRCFRLFFAKVTLFSALSHWRLSCKLPYSQITSLLDLSYRNRFSAYLPLNWAVFALSQPKEVSCLFSANHLNISQRTVTQAVFSSIEPKSTCFLLVFSWVTLFLA